MKFKLLAILTSILVLSTTTVMADDQVVSVPGAGWKIRFNAPKLTPLTGGVPNVYSGRADRLQISFFVEAPRCAGGDSDTNIYNCFANALQKNPAVIWDTERGNTTPNGVQVMYMSKIDSEKGSVKAFNINLLFARRGKWADFHASIVSPTQDDVKELFKLVASVVAEDE